MGPCYTLKWQKPATRQASGLQIDTKVDVFLFKESTAALNKEYTVHIMQFNDFNHIYKERSNKQEFVFALQQAQHLHKHKTIKQMPLDSGGLQCISLPPNEKLNLQEKHCQQPGFNIPMGRVTLRTFIFNLHFTTGLQIKVPRST